MGISVTDIREKMSGFGDPDRVFIDSADDDDNDSVIDVDPVATASARGRPSERTTSLNEGEAKICSVSFKEGGTFCVQEQSKEEFADHILMPDSRMSQLPRVLGSPDIPITDSHIRDERSSLAHSLPAGTPRNYTRSQSTPPARKLSAPTIYCIHGNTFGVARCCENLDGSKHHPVSSVGDRHESKEALNDSTSPVIDISDARPILDPNCQCHNAEANGGGTTMDKRLGESW